MIAGFKRTIYYGLQPLLLLLVVLAWYADPTNEMTYLYAIIGAQLSWG